MTMKRSEDYTQALEKALSFMKGYEKREISVEEFSEIFPEPKESEDERIKEELNKVLDECLNVRPQIVEEKQYIRLIAWLEKQGEQKPEGKTALEAAKEENVDNQNCVKPADKVETRFHEGDWVIVSTAEGDRVVQIASVEYFKDGHPRYFTTEGRWFSNGTKARLLTDKDVETITLPESKVIVNQKPAWSEEDDEMLDSIIEEVRYIGDFPDYPNKEENELYDECLAKVDWLKSLKDRVQPKVDWSEEDEKMLEYALDMIEWYSGKNEDKSRLVSNWLKSFKNRVQPQPQQSGVKRIRKCRDS